jgi:phosphatidylglycerophosphatase A
MKKEIERRKPSGIKDILSLSLTTFGVGYLPLMPGTYGSAVGVLIYLLIVWGDAVAEASLLLHGWRVDQVDAWSFAILSVIFILFCLAGIWASGRSTELFGNLDPSQAVVDEVIGQLIVFAFVPFGVSWPFILAGFLLFRIFDIWKPYPIDSLQDLPAGIGVCADDILAGLYGGICLAIIYAIASSI